MVLNKKRNKYNILENYINGKKSPHTTIDKLNHKLTQEDFTELKNIVNTITIITSSDNLVHNYFYDYETSWDATNCLQVAKVSMPKMGQENIKYWATYQGPLTIYMGSNIEKRGQTTHSSAMEVIEEMTHYAYNSEVKAFFRGEVARIKEYENTITLYIDGIGSRFKQKIPEEFREKYIYNQNVRDSFQAMCEFLGVEFICPPQVMQQTDGNENNLDNQIQNALDVVNNAVGSYRNGNTNTNDSTNNNNNNNSNSNTNTNITNINPNDSSNQNSNSTNQTTDENQQTEQQDMTNIINGYTDIQFDANGAITHGGSVIETSPDMTETLLNMTEHPLEQYLNNEDDKTENDGLEEDGQAEEKQHVIDKVTDFLNGEIFEEIHNNVMNYGAITIQPASTTTSDISTDPSVTGDTGTTGDSSNTDSSNNSSNNSTSTSSIPTASAAAISRHSAPKALSKAYINRISPEHARILRTQNYNTGKYTTDTMQKLLWRSLGITLK